MRLLQRPQGDRDVLVGEVRPAIGERVRYEPGADAVERIDEDVARLLMLDLVIFQLERRYSAADAHFEATMAQVIEHADLLDQAQRRVEREQIDQRTEPHVPGRAGDRAEIDARNRNHVEGRGVMLRNVQAVDPRIVSRAGEREPLVEQRGERTVAVLDVIKQSDLHDLSGFPAPEPLPCRREGNQRRLRRSSERLRGMRWG